MNTKLILAIVIVALLAIVAATYEINNPTDLTNTFTEVEPEDTSESESVTDAVSTSVNDESANSNPETTITNKSSNTDNINNNNYKTSSNQNKNSNNQVKTTNNAKQSSTNTTSQNSNVKKNTSTTSSVNTYAIANSVGKQNGATETKLINSYTANGVRYDVYAHYKNGKIIGESEINSKTGAVAGGAWEGEAP